MAKRGPKPQGEYTGKTVMLSNRVQPSTKARLVEAAQASRRSITQELERRLRMSFAEDDQVENRWGGTQEAAVFRLLCAAVQMVPIGRPGVRWLDDPATYDQAAQAIIGVIELFRPPGTITDPGIPGLIRERGRWAAAETVRRVQIADSASGADRLYVDLRQGLGEIANRPEPGGYTAEENRQLQALCIPFAKLMLKKHMNRRAGGLESDESWRSTWTRWEWDELARSLEAIQALFARRQERLSGKAQPATSKRRKAPARAAR
jgi:hypothetical protein